MLPRNCWRVESRPAALRARETGEGARGGPGARGQTRRARAVGAGSRARLSLSPPPHLEEGRRVVEDRLRARRLLPDAEERDEQSEPAQRGPARHEQLAPRDGRVAVVRDLRGDRVRGRARLGLVGRDGAQHAQRVGARAARDEPARALGERGQREQHDARQHEPEPEHQPPRDVRARYARLDGEADDVAEHDADVDRDVEDRAERAAQPRGRDLGDVHGRHDEAHADAEARDRAPEQQHPEAARERHEQRADDVERAAREDRRAPAERVGRLRGDERAERGDEVERADDDLLLELAQRELLLDEHDRARHDADVVAERRRRQPAARAREHDERELPRGRAVAHERLGRAVGELGELGPEHQVVLLAEVVNALDLLVRGPRGHHTDRKTCSWGLQEKSSRSTLRGGWMVRLVPFGGRL